MKIEILCNDGSPLGVTSKSIFGEDGRMGVGGAELALLTMCEEWTKRGHEVILYNNPSQADASKFEQRPIESFDRHDFRDVLIVFRSPNSKSLQVKSYKIWWSTDQYTVGSFKDFAPTVNKIVCISPFHQKYFADVYGIVDTECIDLPVRVEDYAAKLGKEKNKIIFTSVPDRGLEALHRVWAYFAEEDYSLTITSDYRLWGCGAALNEQYRMMFLNRKNVRFLGAVNRHELIKEQLSAQILLYPCIYDELFCYSVAEAEVAGTYAITSDKGSLGTTNFCKVIPGDLANDKTIQKFAVATKEFLESEDKMEVLKKVRKQAMDRFSPETILDIWEEKIFKGI